MVIQTYKPTLLKQLLPSCVAAIDSTDYSPDLQPCLDGTLFVTATGAQVCKTDPDNPAVWANACCPTSLNWGNDDACWQGTPDFTLPTSVLPMPKGVSSPGATLTKSPTTKAPTTKAPTKAPTTTTPTRFPTTKTPTTKKPTSQAPSKSPTTPYPTTKFPTKKPTKHPTKKPTMHKKKAG